MFKAHWKLAMNLHSEAEELTKSNRQQKKEI